MDSCTIRGTVYALSALVRPVYSLFEELHIIAQRKHLQVRERNERDACVVVVVFLVSILVPLCAFYSFISYFQKNPYVFLCLQFLGVKYLFQYSNKHIENVVSYGKSTCCSIGSVNYGLVKDDASRIKESSSMR